VGAARPVLSQPAIGKWTTLTVSTWGGVTSDGIRDYVGPEFEKHTGAKLVFDIGGQGARYNKLLAQKGNQSADVFFGTDETVVGGLRAGVLEPADFMAVPNYGDLYDWSKTVRAADPANHIAGAQIADEMETWFRGRAVDGFLIQPPVLPVGLDDFVELVIPELQNRGLFRTEYEEATLRENLVLPRPANRYVSGESRT
jgi:hypothetical protein